ncbi:GTP cyclohydrolase II [Terrabacter sp. BE26]|uniref:GTP cyclohydrolase II n=1 Tax=Terrabacter sp. BE26 TaxID=2898152 RepID=UPI0035BE55B4
MTQPATSPEPPGGTLPPRATVRTSVRVPLALADGFHTVALAHTFTGLVDGLEHVALGLGDRAAPNELPPRSPATTPLVRLHSECLTGDVFGSRRCDCGPQLSEAVRRITAAGGYLLYLRQEGRGIGLYPKLDAYVLQDRGLDTYEANLALGFGADERDYTAAAQMLLALEAPRVRILTNNPDKPAQLQRLGLEITRVVPTAVHVSAANAHYLSTKASSGAHTLHLPAAPGEAY